MNLACRKFFEHALERFYGSVHITFDNNLELFNFALADRLVEVVERYFLDIATFFIFFEFLAFRRYLARILFIFYRYKRITSFRHSFKTKHFNRCRRASFLDSLAFIVEKRAYLAGIYARHKGIANTERAVLDHDGGNNSTSLIDSRFYHLAFSKPIVICFEIEQFSLEQDCVKEFRYSFFLKRRHLYKLIRTAPLFRNKA